MTEDGRTTYVTRDRVMKLLSDAEIARVSSVEAATRLDEGDEYLDLEKLDQGVRKADGIMPNMGSVLARKSLEDATWRRILDALGPTAGGAKN